jgi:hypothetical protein
MDKFQDRNCFYASKSSVTRGLCELAIQVASGVRQPLPLLSDPCVEKIVDFFRESGEELQD